jgi:hypothetical protein
VLRDLQDLQVLQDLLVQVVEHQVQPELQVQRVQPERRVLREALVQLDLRVQQGQLV